jgi:hypothetical protein
MEDTELWDVMQKVQGLADETKDPTLTVAYLGIERTYRRLFGDVIPPATATPLTIVLEEVAKVRAEWGVGGPSDLPLDSQIGAARAITDALKERITVRLTSTE